MSTSINKTGNLDFNIQPKQKNHTARNSLGFAGLAVGSACVSDSFEKGFGNNIREAVQSYKENADIVRNAFTKKEYINKFIKDARIKSVAIGAGVAIATTATGMAVGTLIDAALNKNKSNK